MSVEVDARGTRCPYPVIALAKAARLAAGGTEVGLLADDPVALTDVPAWCRMTGSELREVREEDGFWRLTVVTAR
ncbi:MAG: sulfurtransferase TusA family protein [Micrococcales bacterium]|nr:sulfurtransferase TusA family protein [Micrococcales bacterium]